MLARLIASWSSRSSPRSSFPLGGGNPSSPPPGAPPWAALGRLREEVFRRLVRRDGGTVRLRLHVLEMRVRRGSDEG
eukprot:1194453-Prorocentrum_minimum.AAC.4